MSWRTLVVTRRCKLDLNMNYVEVRSEEIKKIHLVRSGGRNSRFVCLIRELGAN